jgi:hypothetical protein
MRTIYIHYEIRMQKIAPNSMNMLRIPSDLKNKLCTDERKKKGFY